MSTRVTAGTKKGVKLTNPPKGTRPLTDRIKISIFDLISDFVPDAEVLDLYAGGGNFGIEALSRGAKSATFVDIAKGSIKSIESNLEKTQFQNKGEIRQERVEDFISNTQKKFDIIMSDPPFDTASETDFNSIARLLSDDGIFILRVPSSTEITLPNRLKEVFQKKYGKSMVHFYHHSNE